MGYRNRKKNKNLKRQDWIQQHKVQSRKTRWIQKPNKTQSRKTRWDT